MNQEILTTENNYKKTLIEQIEDSEEESNEE